MRILIIGSVSSLSQFFKHPGIFQVMQDVPAILPTPALPHFPVEVLDVGAEKSANNRLPFWEKRSKTTQQKNVTFRQQRCYPRRHH